MDSKKKKGGCNQPVVSPEGSPHQSSGPWRKVLLLVSQPSTLEARSPPWFPSPLVAERYPPQQLEDLKEKDLPSEGEIRIVWGWYVCFCWWVSWEPPPKNKWLSCHKQRTSPPNMPFWNDPKSNFSKQKGRCFDMFLLHSKRTARRLAFGKIPSSGPLPPPRV